MIEELTIPDEIDRVESAIEQNFQTVELPLIHHFTPGLYSRTIFIPAGTILTSKIHKTEHQYIVSQGRISVKSSTDGVKHIEGPFIGVTKPGTRRILYAHTNVIWTTFHATNKETPEEVEEEIIEKHVNPLLNGNRAIDNDDEEVFV